MKRNRSTYNLFHLASAIFMIVTLVWLTNSAPFVYASQQVQAGQNKMMKSQASQAGNEEESSNPLTNTTEEKNPNTNSSFSEEYLHDHHVEEYAVAISAQYHKCENAGTYVAYHGELLVPPPNFS